MKNIFPSIKKDTLPTKRGVEDVAPYKQRIEDSPRCLPSPAGEGGPQTLRLRWMRCSDVMQHRFCVGRGVPRSECNELWGVRVAVAPYNNVPKIKNARGRSFIPYQKDN